jgi:hypothetical protein
MLSVNGKAGLSMNPSMRAPYLNTSRDFSILKVSFIFSKGHRYISPLFDNASNYGENKLTEGVEF